MEFLGNFQMFKQKAKLYTILQVWNFLKTYPCSKLVKIIIFGMLGSLQRLSVYLHCIWKTRASWWKASVHKRKKKKNLWHHLFLYSIGLHCKRESPTDPLIHGNSCFAFCMWYNFRQTHPGCEGMRKGLAVCSPWLDWDASRRFFRSTKGQFLWAWNKYFGEDSFTKENTKLQIRN